MLLFSAVLGLFAAAAGTAFVQTMRRIENACDRVWRGPEWARPVAGGLLLGGLLLVLPQMYGAGYPVLDRAVGGGYSAGFLLVLMFAKMLGTSLTLGVGGSGGVLTPSLFVGGMLGSAYGAAAHHLATGAAGPVTVYALIGMSAVFASTARAPFAATAVLLEFTSEYSLILPLITAVFVANLVSKALSPDTIYTFTLRQRGIYLDDPAAEKPDRARFRCWRPSRRPRAGSRR